LEVRRAGAELGVRSFVYLYEESRSVSAKLVAIPIATDVRQTALRIRAAMAPFTTAFEYGTTYFAARVRALDVAPKERRGSPGERSRSSPEGVIRYYHSHWFRGLDRHGRKLGHEHMLETFVEMVRNLRTKTPYAVESVDVLIQWNPRADRPERPERPRRRRDD
jgi:hypothetical protein